jgi:FdhD protein
MLEPAPRRAPAVARTRVVVVEGGRGVRRSDRLAGEEPMEIRAGGPGQDGVAVAVTMRTPGNDFELAAGFLHTEGLLAGRDELHRIRYCGLDGAEQLWNVVTVELARPFDAEGLQRSFFASSSCGICGKASLDQVEVAAAPLSEGPRVAASVIASLPERLRANQQAFDATGGLHAAGLFSADGELVRVREDIGRHNAVDKVIGAALLGGELPLAGRIMAVSGRAGFEIVQKAAVAGVPVMCAVSAPSSLAVDAARRLGMTLCGFVRGGRFNVYAHTERVDAAA